MFSLRSATILGFASLCAAATLLVSAQPVVKARQVSGNIPDSTSCGGTTFDSSDITAAINAGVEDYESGDRPDNYPHAYKHYASEHIELVCGGSSWLEFPLESGEAYSGGSPGAYRVIFTPDGEFCANVYHISRKTSTFGQCDDA